MAEQVTKTIIIKGTVDKIYQLWTDFEHFSEFMPNIKSVVKTGRGTFLWIIKGPSGKDFGWEARVTRNEKNKRIAWNTLTGQIKVSGQVTFQELPQEEVQMTVVLEYAVAEDLPKDEKIYMENADQQVLRALRSFKGYAERSVTV